jgi:hypothetical protein
MSARQEIFAGWGSRDHSAVCLTCRHQHLIPKAEQISPEPWLDWLAKHPGHQTFVMPHEYLSKLANIAPLQHNADVKSAYGSSATITCTLTGLASDTNLLTGRESAAVSNSSNYLEVLFAAKVTTGTSPTAAKQIEVWAYGSVDDTPTYPDVFDGTESAETVTSSDIKPVALKLLAVMPTSNTSDRSYWFGPVSLAAAFGGVVPKNFGVFVTHNTGVNLNATASNQAISYTGIYRTVAP